MGVGRGGMDAGRKVLKRFWGVCGGVAGGFRWGRVLFFWWHGGRVRVEEEWEVVTLQVLVVQIYINLANPSRSGMLAGKQR